MDEALARTGDVADARQPVSADPAVEHMKRAAECAPFGIFCVCGATGRFVFANAAYAALIGWPQDELVASDPYKVAISVTHPDDRTVGVGVMQRMAQGEMDTARYEKRVVRRDGQVRWMQFDLLVTRDAEGRLAYLTQYVTDIDARRSADAARAKLEGELRQSHKLEALGRLAGGVAHDFNNRLAVILGYSEILRDRLPAAGKSAEPIEQIIESAKRASELTRQLLAYSRRQVLKPQVFDLNTAVTRMRALLERVIGEHIALSTELRAEHPILSDPGQIEQVIINLAINARDAMPRGGTLVLRTRDVALGAGAHGSLAPGDYVELTVGDSGAGIAADVLPRIFEPFFTTKDLGHGTGLGLSTVQGIVHQSGGSVRVASDVGRGTTFTIVLPRGELQAIEPPSAPRTKLQPVLRSGAALETVLVCDDDDAVRQLVVEVLNLRGYTVLQARSGREALAVAARHPGPIQLLVSDLVMPELGGIELATALRAERPALRVLYLSGYTADASLLSGALEPGTLFLAKPFMPSELTQGVYALLEAQGE
jgi:PAS domain S-box-containing protein